MTRAKSSPVKRRKEIGSWGGRREGAGRKREIASWKRQKIANEYFACMQKDSDSEYPPRRKGVIRKLAAKFLTTHRMVERVIAEHLPQIRLWAYATKGMNEIQYLQAGKIEKLKPGDYWDQKDKWLRLSVDSAGKRQWILRVIWKGTVVRDVVLGGARLSNLEARERATRARRKIESRQVRAALERAKSKS